MFDDLKQSNQQNQSGQPPINSQPNFPLNQRPQQPAQNRSVGGGVDDMFADIDPAPASPAEKPSAIQSGKMNPISQNVPPSSVQQAPVGPPTSDMIVAEGSSGAGKKIVAIIIVILILGLAGGAVYYFMYRDNGTNTENTNTNTNNEIPVENTNINTNTNNAPDDTTFDDDFDGLNNAEEKSLGTDINNADTDNDGLFDGQEVNKYKTNPLVSDTDLDGLNDYQEVETYATDPNKADTDGDGYQDGVEVGNGYNPLGEGKLDNTDDILGNDVIYKTYTNDIIGYSVSVPDTWVMDEADMGDEEVAISDRSFWPQAFGVGGHYMEISIMRNFNMTEEIKAEILADMPIDAQDDLSAGLKVNVEEGGVSALLFFRESSTPGEYTDFVVLSYDYSLSGEPNPEYLKVYQDMLNSFTFLNE